MHGGDCLGGHIHARVETLGQTDRLAAQIWVQQLHEVRISLPPTQERRRLTLASHKLQNYRRRCCQWVLEDAWGRSVPHVRLATEMFTRQIAHFSLERLDHVNNYMALYRHSVSNTRGELSYPHGRYSVRHNRAGRANFDPLIKIMKVDVLYTIMFMCDSASTSSVCHAIIHILTRPVISASDHPAAQYQPFPKMPDPGHSTLHD